MFSSSASEECFYLDHPSLANFFGYSKMDQESHSERENFIAEACDLLENFEIFLLQLEDDPENADLIASSFRALHTIKGNSDYHGFPAVKRFTHEVESIFDVVRKGHAVISKELISLMLSAHDYLLQ